MCTTLCIGRETSWLLLNVFSVGLWVQVFEASCSCAVTFRGSEYGLPLESVSVTRMCVACSTVADVRPGPLTWQV